jgi:hypothetical protein
MKKKEKNKEKEKHKKNTLHVDAHGLHSKGCIGLTSMHDPGSTSWNWLHSRRFQAVSSAALG